MASTLFSRTFLAASHRLITPSLLPETTLNLAGFLSVSRNRNSDLNHFSTGFSFDHFGWSSSPLLQRRSFYSQLGASSTWARRAMGSSGVGGKAGYSMSSVPTNEPVVSVDWLHSNLREPDLKVSLLFVFFETLVSYT